MTDISPKLYEAIKTEFESKVASNKTINRVLDGINSGKYDSTTYGYQYSELIGTALASSFQKVLSSDVLPDGRMYYNIAKSVVEPFLKDNYEATAEVATKIQQILFDKVGIGLKPITPKVNQDKINGIINRLDSEPNFDKVKWILNEPVVNFTQSAMDDSIQQNVDFQGAAGRKPTVTRLVTRKCCDWCSGLSGKYSYPNVPKDVYRRHENCRCMVEYNPGDGTVQNVWTKEISVEDPKGPINSFISRQIFGAYNDINDPYGKKREEHANKYYESIRNSNKDYLINTIARNSGISRPEVRSAIDHLFFTKYNLDGEYKYFDPSYIIAESIRRLREGTNIQPHDIVLIRHEALESIYMNEQRMDYDSAHSLAEIHYNYIKAYFEWLVKNA